MTTPALSAREVKKVYRPRNRPEVPALKGVSLEVGRGERVGLLGRNGAGKTTFLKIASTLLRPTSGEITIFGHDVMAHPEEVRPLIAVVPQEGKPFFHLTPREQVYTYLRTRGFSRESARTRTEEAIEQMGLGEVADRLNVTLSGGQMQRAMVATIIATEAPLLFLDEPTIGMDPFARRGVWDSLRRLTRKGSTILLTTHYLDEAERLADRVAILQDGRIQVVGSVRHVARRAGVKTTIKFTAPQPVLAGAVATPAGLAVVLRGEVASCQTDNSGPALRELLDWAAANGLGDLDDLSVEAPTLEDSYLQLVSNGGPQ